MRVDVLYFGVLRELMGAPQVSVEVAAEARVEDLLDWLGGELSGQVRGTIAVAVNREYAGLETVLRDGDEVALLPPVSGGRA